MSTIHTAHVRCGVSPQHRGNAILVTNQASGSTKIDPLMASHGSRWLLLYGDPDVMEVARAADRSRTPRGLGRQAPSFDPRFHFRELASVRRLKPKAGDHHPI
jgi:hypothetical protein